MTNSHKPTSKCFSGILRRFQCTGSLPTYPSDHIIESDTIRFHFPGKESKTVAKTTQAPSTPSPGIVARLMGLDTLPDINWVPRETTLDSILRSRSVNFVDYLPEFNLTQAQHRQVRTSVSFREVPTFLHQQNQDCYVLCFEKAVAKNNDMRVNEGKSKKSSEEVKLKKSDGSRNKENISERVPVKKKSEAKENKKKACKGMDKRKSTSVSTESSSKVGNVLAHAPKKDVCRKPPATLKARDQANPINRKQVSVGSNFTKKKKKQQASKKEVPECNTENSSPISFFEFLTHLEAPISEETRLMGLNRRAKSSSKICNCDYPSPNIVSTLNADDDHELGTINNKAEKSVKIQEIEEYYTQLLCEICRLTEEDMKESNWVTPKVLKFEDFEEICMEFGQQILELLVKQVVDELEGFQTDEEIVFVILEKKNLVS
ncbi:hypothetical protein F0562_015254 [Nyssa sinensis]|uniref:DUF3741 domain-containing protein n=1 Tax=Nyssa sinensis TaxID=561372 RepID=A0A5J4ZGT3_9ASTE|nr:hypothetical protein F0562_015254 [Nyssa sinensis]